MNKCFIFLAFLFFLGGNSTTPCHASQAPDFLISIQKTAQQQPHIVLTPPPGHHINLKAPHFVEFAPGQKIKPVSATPTRLIFKARAASHVVKATAFLCDNVNSFCEKHVVSAEIEKLAVTKEKLNFMPAVTSVAHSPATHSNHGRLVAQKLGFIYNDADKALLRARTEHKPLLIEFFGIWCPPCNMLDATVFKSTSYKKTAQKFITVKLDADSEASWALKERFKVGGYPTVIFANEQGQEISRVVGSRSAKLFVKLMNEAWEKRNLSVASESKKEESQSIADKHFDAALKAIEEKNESELSKALEALAELTKNPQKLENDEATLADVWQMIGDIHEKQGHTGDAKAAFAHAVKEYEKTLKALGPKALLEDRGYNLERAYCLGRAGHDTEALQIYERLEKLYPQEFTFHYAHGRFLMDRKDFKNALPHAEKAFQFSYGDNRLRAASLLVQIQKEQGRKGQALKIVKEILATTPVPSDPNNRTHRYIGQLKKLEEQLGSL